MLCDPFKRKVDYLRISVTPHCNLKCVYCMPAMGCHQPGQSQFLDSSEITRLTRVLVGLGIRKVRFTGGEPLVRPDIIPIVERVSAISGLEDIAITSNGMLLARYAKELKTAGVGRVNVSMDSMDPEKFRQITRGGDIKKVWKGILAAVDAGLSPVKINVVLVKGVNDSEIGDFARMTKKHPIHVRFIELMPKGSGGFFKPEHFIEIQEAQARCESVAPLEAIFKEDTNGPATLYRYANAPGRLGFIGAITKCFCADCNRLRLTAEGVLRPCLDWEEGIDLKGPMRKGASDQEIEGLIRLAVLMKPKEHRMTRHSITQDREPMCAIGG